MTWSQVSIVYPGTCGKTSPNFGNSSPNSEVRVMVYPIDIRPDAVFPQYPWGSTQIRCFIAKSFHFLWGFATRPLLTRGSAPWPRWGHSRWTPAYSPMSGFPPRNPRVWIKPCKNFTAHCSSTSLVWSRSIFLSVHTTAVILCTTISRCLYAVKPDSHWQCQRDKIAEFRRVGGVNLIGDKLQKSWTIITIKQLKCKISYLSPPSTT